MNKSFFHSKLLQLKAFRQKMKDNKGATMVEYVLLAALIAIVCIIAIRLLGFQTSRAFSQVTSALCSGM